MGKALDFDSSIVGSNPATSIIFLNLKKNSNPIMQGEPAEGGKVMKIITTNVLEWDDKELTEILNEMAEVWDAASKIIHQVKSDMYFGSKEEALSEYKKVLLDGKEIELAEFLYSCGFFVQNFVKKSWMMETLSLEETKTEEGS